MDDYKVLSRKYRPQGFSELLGQDIMVKIINNAIEQGKFPHAIILSGVRGVGKTTTARIIAQVLNCSSLTQKQKLHVACGECLNCKGISNGSSLDVIEMDAASRNGIDDIKEIIDNTIHKPLSARYKVFIIDEVHMISKQAFNALLKTLEEPPKYVKFIFATTELQKIPQTVLSRCVHFNLQRFTNDDLEKLLAHVCKSEKINIDESAKNILKQLANGSARDCLSLLEKVQNLGHKQIKDHHVRVALGMTKHEIIFELLEYIIHGKTKEALQLLNKNYSQNLIISEILHDLLKLLHELSFLQITQNLSNPHLFSKEIIQKIHGLSQKLTIPTITKLWQFIVNSIDELKKIKLTFQALEMIIIRACYLSKLPNPEDLLAEISANNKIQTLHDEKKKLIIDDLSVEKLPEEENKTIDVKINSIQNLIDIVQDNKDQITKYDLENHLYLIKIQNEKNIISFTANHNLSKDFKKNLQNILYIATNKKWDVLLDYNQEHLGKTIREEKQYHQQQLIQQAQNFPLVQEIIQMFDNVVIEKVKTIKKT